jgi:hypothetical protein
VYSPERFGGRIADSSGNKPDVTAVFIAPAGPVGDGKFLLKHGEIYGAVVTGNLTLNEGGEVHFDRALLNERLVLAPNVPRIEYLYLTENEIKVEKS